MSDNNIGVLMKPIAKVLSGFPEKFGIPRQSGIAKDVRSVIVFEDEYKNIDALRGLEDFSHIWIIWYFSENEKQGWSPTVRPPRLGGNKRIGVFASRSPFRPNPIGLSLVKLEKIENDKKLGPVIYISGADIMDKTPVFDIKPYLAYTESPENATSGFADGVKNISLDVEFAAEAKGEMSAGEISLFKDILSQDPRPAYQNDPDRKYSFEMFGFHLSFYVNDNVLTVFYAKRICEEGKDNGIIL